MTQIVEHRWHHPNLDATPGAGIPDVGDIILGSRHHWRVLEVRPIESRKHPNAWRGRLECLGPHNGKHLGAKWAYPSTGTYKETA